MSAPKRSTLVAALLATLATLGTGCGADLGAGAGVEARTGHAMGFGRVAAATKVPLNGGALNEQGALVGVALESRVEQRVGSRWDAGVMLGWGKNAAEIDGRAGWEAYVEFGTPLHDTLFRNGSSYVGATFAVPVMLGATRRASDLNGGTWFAVRRFELVPMLRYRAHFDVPDDAPVQTRHDLALGVTLRLRTFTDLF